MASVGYDAKPLMTRVGRQMILPSKRVWRRRPWQTAQRVYVFIAGMQRSGTNMVMDVLERSFDTDVYHETDPRAFQNFEMREEAVIRKLAVVSPAPFFIIKALCELDKIPALMDSFIPARTLWVLRDMEDVVNSATRSFRNFPAQVGRIAKDRDAAQWRGRGMSNETYEQVRALYHPDMNESTAAALTWYFRNVLFFEHGFDRNDQVLLVPYERLVMRPDLEFRRIFNFLGLSYSPWISRIVFASSIHRRPPPPIEPEVKALCDTLAQRFQILLGNSHVEF